MAKKAQVRRSEPESTPSFEDALGKLEKIVANLEDGQLPLDKALADYEEGVKHLKVCYDLLEKAEQRIELLQGTDDAGAALTEPFEPPASGGSEVTPSRGKRRRTSARRNVDDDRSLF